MKVSTFFPVSLPRLPGVDRVIKHICSNATGTTMTMTIDGDEMEATIVEMRHVKGGFEITTEVPE